MRTPSSLDRIAESYVDRLIELQPEVAIDIGAPLGERTISDFSPAGESASTDLRRAVLAEAKEAADRDQLDAVDQVTLSALEWDLSIQQELADAGLTVGTLNNIDSPLQQIRDPFTLMPMESKADWEDVIRRVERPCQRLTVLIFPASGTRLKTVALLQGAGSGGACGFEGAARAA